MVALWDASKVCSMVDERVQSMAVWMVDLTVEKLVLWKVVSMALLRAGKRAYQ